jgi:hypothetical protein
MRKPGALARGLGLALLTAGCGAAQRPGPPTAGPEITADAAEQAAAQAARARTAVSRSDEEKDPAARSALVREAMEAGQRCEELAPSTPGCDYALALALGVQAREQRAAALQTLPTMVRLLRAAADRDPGLDFAGPNRVLAVLLVRAPGWPLGPGDAEAGVASARRAVALAPDHAPNQAALAEALHATGDEPGAAAAARRAVELARQAVAAGEPQGPRWLREAERLP